MATDLDDDPDNIPDILYDHHEKLNVREPRKRDSQVAYFDNRKKIKLSEPVWCKSLNTSQAEHESFLSNKTASTLINQGVVLPDVPRDGDYLNINRKNGKRYFLRFESEESLCYIPDTDRIAVNIWKNDEIGHVCSSEAVHHPLNVPSDRSIKAAPSHPGEDLWSAVYRPQRYFDLLSDETINRTFLRWIKAWDHYVFRRQDVDIRIRDNSKMQIYADKKYSPLENYESDELKAGEIDESDGRPRYKLLLLSGPPGSGKTTLSHLLAEQSGYQVIEMNSSDDRSPAILRERISAVMNTQTSLNRSTDGETLKPCCIILDEIDGALSTSVDLLAEAAKASLRGARGPSHRSGLRHSLVIRRPIICICNDL